MTSVVIMALRPDEFYDHARAAADDGLRLPLARMTGWEVSPFEAEGLRVSALRPPVLPEPPRHGEDPADCDECRSRDEGIWLDDRWRLTRIPGVGVPLVLMLYPRDHYDMADLPDELAAELGVLTTHVVRHVQALPHVSRAHVYRIGDGAAHLHVWFFARPEGQAQLFGSWLPVWDDLLPAYPRTWPTRTRPPSRTRWPRRTEAGAPAPTGRRTSESDGGVRPAPARAGRTPFLGATAGRWSSPGRSSRPRGTRSTAGTPGGHRRCRGRPTAPASRTTWSAS
ncbi:conserved hypothetical protein [Streptomyces sp. C]|nr:conserved hypothetical protein [Streptomyces sp. C]